MKSFFIKLIFISSLIFILNNNCKAQTWSVDFGDSLWFYDPDFYVTFSNSELYSYQNKLFVFGGFNRVGIDTAENFAYWNGINWNPLVKKWWNSDISDMKYYKNNLYVCGDFEQIDNIENLRKLAKWDGTNWNFVTNDSLGSIDLSTLLWHHDTLFLSGYFGQIGGVYSKYVIQWDGTNWLSMEGGMNDNNSNVLSNAVYNDQIHVAGSFPYAGGHSIKSIARWDGQHWQPVGAGLYEQVRSMYVDTIANVLYVGDHFGLIDSTGVHFGKIAKWDGQTWSLMDSSGGNVLSIITYRGKLYAGGYFYKIGTDSIPFIAKWNGSDWDSIVQIECTVFSMAVFNDELIVGGCFTKINGIHAFGLARYYEPPDSACFYFNPAIYTDADTFYLQNDTVSVQFFNNNSHANIWAWNFGDSGTDTVWCPVHVYNQPGTFTVNVNVTELWCNKSAQKIVVISDLLNSQQPIANSQHPTALRIYPNPASGSITIEITGATVPFSSGQLPSGIKGSEGNAGSNNRELRITNQHGKLIKAIPLKEPNSKFEINTKDWAKGTYLCSLVVSGKKVKVEKLVIE